MSNKMLQFDSNDFSDTRLDYVLKQLEVIYEEYFYVPALQLIQDLKERNIEESRIGKVGMLIEKINALDTNEKEDLFDACFEYQCDQCSRDYSEEEIRDKEREINDLENSLDNCQEENKNLQYEMDELTKEIQDLKDDNKILTDKVSDLETEIGNLEDYIRDNVL